MGRTIASAAQLIAKHRALAKTLKGGLGRGDQLILDELFDSLIQHQAPIANADSSLPLYVMVLVMLLEERKRAARVLGELRTQLSAIKNKTEG